CLLNQLVRCSRDERPDGSLPAFAWGDVAEAQPLSRPLQAGVRFFRPPVPAALSADLAACFPWGSATGLPSSACVTGGGRHALFPGGVGCPCHGTPAPVSPPQSEVSASYPPAWLTVFTKRSRVLAISSPLALLPADARRDTVASRSQRQPMAVGTLSEG